MALLTRLILLDPGTIQSHPEMGVGISTVYRYSHEGTEVALQADIRRQIDTYLPQFQGAEVQVQMVDHSFRIIIVLNQYAFGFLYDIEETTLTTRYTKLADL